MIFLHFGSRLKKASGEPGTFKQVRLTDSGVEVTIEDYWNGAACARRIAREYPREKVIAFNSDGERIDFE